MEEIIQDHSCHWKYAVHIIMENSCENSICIAERAFLGKTFTNVLEEGQKENEH